MKLLAYLCLICFAMPALAVPAADDAVKEFVRQQLASYAEDLRKYWRGEDLKQPPGGYLLRFEFDLTGDGRPEIFVRTTLAEGWNVFSTTGGNSPRLIQAQQLWITPYGFFVDNSSVPPIITFVFPKGKGSGLDEFTSLQFNGQKLAEVRSFDASNTVPEEDSEKFDEDALRLREAKRAGYDVGRRFKPSIQKIQMALYLQNPNAPWKPYNTRFAPHQQYLDPGDKEINESLEDFTFEQARRLVEHLTPNAASH